MQRGYAAHGEDTMVASSSDGTVTDLGTLVIIDDDDEDNLGTMKSENTKHKYTQIHYRETDGG